jgi:Domain of unknown function (DUF4118)
MAISAPSGNAPRLDGPAAGFPRRPRPSPVAGVVMTRPGLLRRYPPRDLWAVGAALAGPLAASAVLLPLRAGWSNTNAALLLVVVVVAVAAAGNRHAGALAAVGAAVWFDFFFTLPYYRLTIRSSDDVTTAVLLLVTGLVVSQLAAWARKLTVAAVTGAGYLESMHGTAALAQASRSPEVVAEYVGGLLTGLLDLQECGLSTARCAATRRGWTPTAALSTAATVPGMLSRRVCLPNWSCGCSATASTTGGS